MKYANLLFLSAVVSFQSVAANNDVEVDKAIDFLKTACVTSGSTLDISAEADGALNIKNIGKTGVSASVTVTHKQLEGLTDAASEFSVNQASEMRKCMQPYIERIISVYLQGSAQPDEITIETPTNYFDLNEFNLVMSTFSEYPQTLVRFKDATRLIQLHPAKVDYYIKLAIKNELIYFYSPKNGKGDSGYVIDDKGVNYVLSKGLVKEYFEDLNPS